MRARRSRTLAAAVLVAAAAAAAGCGDSGTARGSSPGDRPAKEGPAAKPAETVAPLPPVKPLEPVAPKPLEPIAPPPEKSAEPTPPEEKGPAPLPVVEKPAGGDATTWRCASCNREVSLGKAEAAPSCCGAEMKPRP
jgi:hypothetical protein